MKKNLLLFIGALLLLTAATRPAFSCQAAYTWQSNSPGVVAFHNTSTGFLSGYSWSFGDGTTSALPNPVHTYAASGVYSVCLTIFDSLQCQSTFCDSVLVTVSSSCAASFTYTVNAGSATFTNTSTGTPGYALFWDFGDGTTSSLSNPVHQFAFSGSYPVCLTIADSLNNCFNTYCSNVFISSGTSGNCSATFSYYDSSSFIYFIPDSVGAGSTYTWTFSNGTTYTGAYPVVQMPSNNVLTACLTVTNTLAGCFDTQCDSVVLSSSNCNAVIGYQSTLFNFIFNAYVPNDSIASYLWSFGDGTSSTASNPSHNYINSGIYNLCLTYTTASGCTNTTCQLVAVTTGNPACNATFYYSDSLNTYYFSANGGNSSYTYTWDFGDSTSGTGPYISHTYAPGVYNVCLTIYSAADSCSATHCTLITVAGSGNCQAAFTYSVDTLTNTVTFNNTSTGNYTNTTWYLGNGTYSSLNNPVITYNPGGYWVCLTIYNNNGCQSSFCDSVWVGINPTPCMPVFYSYPDSVAGNGQVNFGIYNTCGGVTYVWNFGDSSSSYTGTTPVHQYADSGWYYVCVDAFDSTGLIATYCDSVYSFRIGNISGIANASVSLSVHVSPNPAHDVIRVELNLPDNGMTSFDVVAVDGRLISHDEKNQQAGSSVSSLSVKDLQPGFYLLKINHNGRQNITRLLIQ